MTLNTMISREGKVRKYINLNLRCRAFGEVSKTKSRSMPAFVTDNI